MLYAHVPIDVPNIKIMCPSGTVVRCIRIKIDTRDLDVLGVKVCMGSAGNQRKVES